MTLLAALFLAGSTLTAPQQDSLAGLAWLAGDWFGSDGTVEMEEFWTNPQGEMMLGAHRDVRDGKAVSFEFFRIESTPDGIVYFASPRGRPPVPFRAIENSDKKVVFENRTHDFPKRIIYWQADDGSLHARVEGDPGDRERAMEWRWTRGKP